jgi:hypothetical protein
MKLAYRPYTIHWSKKKVGKKCLKTFLTSAVIFCFAAASDDVDVVVVRGEVLQRFLSFTFRLFTSGGNGGGGCGGVGGA